MPSRDRSSDHPGRVDPWWLDVYRRLAPVWSAAWPGALHRIERLPKDGPYLLVANHSGLGIAECVTLIGAWTESFGETRPLAAMAHPALFRAPAMAQALRGFGVVEATRAGAAFALEHGAALLLFPGGEEESMRPLWQARRVDFRERRGWIRLARRHGLPIVPLAITGSHVTAPNLGRATVPLWLTELIGVRSVPLPLLATVTGLLAGSVTRGSATRRAIAAAAWFSATALVPWIPSRIGFHVLDPVEDAGQTEEEIYGRVVDAIEHELNHASAWGSIWV